MAYPTYLREKARELRVKRKLSLLEIAERLALPKTTVFYWIRDLPDPEIKYRDSPARARARAKGARRIRRFARNPVTYWFHYHADQDPEYLVRFWSFGLGVDPKTIGYQRKSNSGHLSGRTWRSKHGVFTVRANDTNLRARLQAWMDLTQDRWVDSIHPGV